VNGLLVCYDDIMNLEEFENVLEEDRGGLFNMDVIALRMTEAEYIRKRQGYSRFTCGMKRVGKSPLFLFQIKRTTARNSNGDDDSFPESRFIQVVTSIRFRIFHPSLPFI
jgi:hypothetical protein